VANVTAHILVPLDGSPRAESMLPIDVTLARTTSSGITLLRAVSPYESAEPGSDPLELHAEALCEARAYLESIVKRLEDSGLEVRTELVEADPAAAITEYAHSHPEVWLVTMAHERHSQATPARFKTFGNVVAHVLHATHKPVLLVRTSRVAPMEPAEQAPADLHFHNIVVPLDGSRFAEEAVEQARRLALLNGAHVGHDTTLVLICAVPPPDVAEIDQAEFIPRSVSTARDYEAIRLTCYLTETAERLRADGLHVVTELVYGHPAEMILLAAGRVKGDMIVMCAPGSRDRERLWLGSVAQNLVQSSPLPVLLLRAACAHPVVSAVTENRDRNTENRDQKSGSVLLATLASTPNF
jgi:nucleotide-binding universal stress UspA family protein